MNSRNLDSIIDKLNIIFSTLGYPVELVSDNGPPFDYHGFKQFCEEKGINYINTPPYNLQSNGLAERSVRTIKEYLKRDFTNKKKHLSMQNRITNVLSLYRNTPCMESCKCSAELIFKSKLKTELDFSHLEIEFHESKDPVKIQVFGEGDKKTYI